MCWLLNNHVCYKFQNPTYNSIGIFVLRQVNPESKDRACRKVFLLPIRDKGPRIQDTIEAVQMKYLKVLAHNISHIYIHAGAQQIKVPKFTSTYTPYKAVEN